MADFEVNKDSGIGSSSIRVRPSSVNSTESDRRAILTVTVNGISKNVNLIQRKGAFNYEYKLETNKDSITILGKGGSDTLSITSQRRRIVNGTPNGDWEDVEVTAEFLEELPFTAGLRFMDTDEKILEVSITSKNYTEQSINGAFIIKQLGGLTKTIDVTQAAGEVTFNYRVDPPMIQLTVPKNQTLNAWEGSTEFTMTGYRAKLVEGKQVSEETYPFKIPTIGQVKLLNLQGVATQYWFTNYGSIENTLQTSFSGTCHMKKASGTYSQAFSVDWECEFSDGGRFPMNTLLSLQLI